MTIGYVQDTGLISTPNAVSSTSPNFGSLPTAGNHIIALVSTWANPGDANVYSDNQGGANTWSEDKLVSGVTGLQGAGIGSTKIVSASGTYTVTVTDSLAANKYWEWVAVEFSGLNTTSHLDQTGSATGGTGITSLAVNSAGANSQANDLVTVILSNSGGGAAGGISDPPTGYDATHHWVQQNCSATVGMQASFKVVAGVETSGVTWTFNSTSGEGVSGGIATYKGAATAGGGPIVNGGPLTHGSLIRGGRLVA